MHQASYKEAQEKYELLRESSHKMTHDNLPNILVNRNGITIQKNDITLKGINFFTLQKLKNWETSGKRVVSWDWEEVQKKYKTHPKDSNYQYGTKSFFCAEPQ